MEQAYDLYPVQQPGASQSGQTPEQAAELTRSYMQEGASPSEAAKRAAAECHVKKGEVYRLLVTE